MGITMNKLYIYLALLYVLFSMGCKATAQQKFTTHAVKRGETLSSIAREYKVTTGNILKYNKEIKEGGILSPNTILAIPLPSDTAYNSSASQQTTRKDTNEIAVSQREPIGFTSHRVRKNETLFGVTKRYAISEDEIKRYNRDLYSNQLEKKMVLRIPRYAGAAVGEETLDPDDFEKYVVQPKETRYSIASKYGITMDSLLSLNPTLPESTSELAIGQELLLPRIAGSTLEQQQVQLYESYTVPPKKTLFSLSQEYGIPGDEIVRLNPEIVQRSGLKEGMVIRLPKRTQDEGAVNTDNFIFYEVKPKQTEYSLTRNLGISWRELSQLNPELAQGLKSGMILKLPKEKASDLEVKNSLILDKINLLDSIHMDHKPKLVFMLPFRLDKINLEDAESAAEAIERSNAISYSLGLYTGALVALDSVARLGISVDVKTLDTQLSLEKVKSILMQENLKGVSAIIGPLDAKSLNEVAVQAAKFQIPVIAPIASDSNLSLANVFFSIPTDTVLRRSMLEYMEGEVTDQNIIVIADEKNKVAAQQIMAKFPQARLVEIKEEEENISINLETFTEMLVEENDNWIFVESDNVKLVPGVTSILNSSNNEKVKVRMFTTNKNRAFDNDVISSTHLSNLRFTFPSSYREVGNDGFVVQYRKKWGSDPDRYAVRGFDLTYDLLLKLAYKSNLFEAADLVGITEYSANKFNYTKDPASGYYNSASYIMMFDNMFIKEINP